MNKKCPKCGTEGADILLTSVFCVNKDCTWYDKEQATRMANKQWKNLGDADNFREKSSDPDITPIWYPDYSFLNPTNPPDPDNTLKRS